MSANRTQSYHDFGYVALDILGVRPEDAGTYTVVAKNSLGEAQLSSSMQVESKYFFFSTLQLEFGLEFKFKDLD